MMRGTYQAIHNIESEKASSKAKSLAYDGIKEELLNHMRVIAAIRSVATGETQIDGLMDDTEALQWIVEHIDAEL